MEYYQEHAKPGSGIKAILHRANGLQLYYALNADEAIGTALLLTPLLMFANA